MTEYLDTSERLRQARIAAGFDKISDAVRAFGWTYSTYASHENGHRGIKTPDLRKYASAFNVTEAWLISGKEVDETTHHVSATTGFSETLAEYHPPTDGLRQTLHRLAEQVSPSARALTILSVPRAYPSLSLAAGDIVLVDLSRITAAPGQIGVSRIVTPNGDTTTTFRILTDGSPLPPLGEPPLHSEDAEAIVGIVVGMVRGAPMGTVRTGG